MLSAKRPVIKLTGAAALAPVSALLQALPPMFLTPWFMRVDLVAVPWIVCWMAFGLKAGLLCMAISLPLVGILGPFAGGLVVGATMKAMASVWMMLIPAAFALKAGGVDKLLGDKWLFGLSGLAAVSVRDLTTALLNLYFAIPVFFGMTPNQVLEFFTNPRFQTFVARSLGLIGLGAYLAEVAFWNALQGFIDLYASLAVGLILAKRLKYAGR